MKKLLILSLVSINVMAKAPDSKPYDFDWKSAADMSGAFMICGLTGFTQPNCPKVLRKCMTDRDLLKFKVFGVESKCLDLFAFMTDKKDVENAIDHASNEAGHDVTDEQRSNYHKAGDYEQDNSKRATRESYRHTKYYNAEEAAEDLVRRDYEYYYYYGDGNGGGGWGHPDYGRNHFNDSVYRGETPQQAYNREYQRVLRMGGGCLNPLGGGGANRAIDDCVGGGHFNEQMARRAGEEARERAIARRDNSFENWREQQPWSQVGYNRTGFERSYNTDRLTAYYHAYLAELPRCGGNENCAKNRAWNNINNMPFRG